MKRLLATGLVALLGCTNQPTWEMQVTAGIESRGDDWYQVSAGRGDIIRFEAPAFDINEVDKTINPGTVFVVSGNEWEEYGTHTRVWTANKYRIE